MEVGILCGSFVFSNDSNDKYYHLFFLMPSQIDYNLTEKGCKNAIIR